MNINLSKTILAGLAGTLVMTIVMLLAPMMGMPEMNIGKMPGDFMNVGVAVGWIMHFMIGTMLAVIYVAVFLNKLSGSGIMRGTIYGLVPWFVSQVIMNPMMGAGIFASNTPSPMMMVMGSMLGHLMYGATVGKVYGTSVE